MTRKNTTNKSKTPSDGSKEFVLAQTEKTGLDPDGRFPVQLDPSQRLTQARMFADGGRKVAVMSALGRRAETAKFPRTVPEVYDSLEDMLRFCQEYQLSPTLGIFAIWNGVTMQRVNQIERATQDERSTAIGVCKETIRAIIEQATIEAEFNPLIYFHMMKSQFGLAERTEVAITHEDNSHELSPEEYDERVLQLTQNSDGVFKEEQK